MSFIAIVFILQRILFQSCECGQIPSSYEDMSNAEFIKNLFDGYSVNIVPVSNSEKPVVVDLSLFHLSIDNIDMRSKIVSARIIFGLKWTDEYLKWNSSDFKNISKFTIQPNSVWLPDFYIGNSEEMYTFIKAENAQEVFLNHNGIVEAWLYLQIEIGVDLDIYKYPFDEQICDLEFSSWMQSDRTIDISVNQSTTELDPSELSRQSGEWDIITVDRNRLIKTFDSYVTNYTLIQFRFSLQRKWRYTILNLVAPVVITSLLNPLSFLLPVESGERISLSNTVFLTLAVFFSIVNDSLPKTSERIPVVVAYIGLQMLGSALTIVFTIFSLALYHSNRNIDQSVVLKFVVSKAKMQENGINGESGVTEMENQRNNGNRERWMKASNILDKACFWLSLAWNLGVLTLVLMEVTFD